MGSALLGALDGRGTFLGIDGETVSRADFLNLARGRRATLHAAGVHPGDHVWVSSGRGSAFWVDLVAVWLHGAVAVPVEPTPSEAVAAAMAERTSPAAVFADGGRIWPSQAVVVASAARADWEAAPATPRPEAPAAVLYTSGSSGTPKGVRLTHEALLGNARATLAAIPLQRSDRLAIAMPFHFTSAICHFLAACLRGATLLGTERTLLPADLAAFMRAQAPTCFGGAPLQLAWIADALRQEQAPLRWLMASGDQMTPAVEDRVSTAFPSAVVVAAYGLTEVGGRLCVRSEPDPPGDRGSVGRPVGDMRIAVRADDGAALPPLQTGEIWVDGPYLFDGYVGEDPRIPSRGFRTGDLGFVDTHGRLHVQGRIDDVFKCAGQKVSAVRIANALQVLPGIVDAAVIPIDDARIGTVPAAFVVLATGEKFDKAAMMRSLRASLPPNHLPHSLTELPAIPRTGSGKVRREALRARLNALSH
jgi:acyl-CoA synthetase (AMP-forming)/AMP-acid ligase II